jgi:hypothetical protein
MGVTRSGSGGKVTMQVQYCTIGQYRAGTGFDLKPNVATTIRTVFCPCTVWTGPRAQVAFGPGSSSVLRTKSGPQSRAFLHSLGHSRPGRASSKSGHVRYAPKTTDNPLRTACRDGPGADSCTPTNVTAIRSPRQRGRAVTAARSGQAPLRS